MLAFIGVKLIIEAVHGNRLPFINGGQPIDLVPAIPTWLSLIIIVDTPASLSQRAIRSATAPVVAIQLRPVR